jgi:hypothetical protein
MWLKRAVSGKRLEIKLSISTWKTTQTTIGTIIMIVVVINTREKS